MDAGRVLAGERVVDLEKDIDFPSEVLVDVDIASVDDTSDRGLRNPGNGLIHNGTFEAVEEMDFVAEDILNHSTLEDLVGQVLMPFFKLREFPEIPFLDFLDFVD